MAAIRRERPAHCGLAGLEKTGAAARALSAPFTIEIAHLKPGGISRDAIRTPMPLGSDAACAASASSC